MKFILWIISLEVRLIRWKINQKNVDEKCDGTSIMETSVEFSVAIKNSLL